MAEKHPELVAEVHPWTAWPRVEATWTQLVDRCDHATFFVTTAWVETWLESFGALFEPTLLIFRTASGDAVGACLLVRRDERKGPFRIRRVYLNTCGEDDADSPCLEFNTLLCLPGYEHAMAAALARHLDELRTSAPWHELEAPGMIEGTAMDALADVFGDQGASRVTKPTFYVDLNDVRASGKDYIEGLPPRDRTRYRQMVRKYGAHGEIALDDAGQSVDDSLAMLDELAALHQRAWVERGQPGSFASDVFYDFHRRLIRRCAPLGEIQLLRLRAGNAPIGCLYNMVYRGKVYFYQCGFDYHLEEKLSPGVIVHSYAARHAAEAGLAEYDFMAGDMDYKRKLGNKQREMSWLTWRASTMKMRTFDLLRGMKRRVQQTSIGDRKNAVLGALRSLAAPLRGQE